MRKVCFFILLCLGYVNSIAQIIENPIFDRTDVPEFRVKKVKIMPDTTYVYCTYLAEEGSWACISNETFIEDIEKGVKYKIIKANGIPLSPDKREFVQTGIIDVLLYFPHVSADKINIIEDENNYAFNIYGINLKESYTTIYTGKNIDEFRKSAVLKEEKGDWLSAINYTFKQMEASQFIYGILSLPCAWAMYNLTMEFPHTNDYDNSIEWGNKAIGILNELAKDTFNIDILARVYGNVCNAYFDKGKLLNNPVFFKKALDYSEKALNIRKQLYGDNNELFANSLINYANTLKYVDRISEAIESFKSAIDIFQSSLGRFTSRYYNAMWGLMQSYLQAKDYNKAQNVSLDALVICDSLYSNKSEQYLHLLSFIQYNYYCNNRIEESIEYANKAYQLSNFLYDYDDSRRNIYILNLMRLFSYIGKNDEIIRIGNDNAECVKKDKDLAATLSSSFKSVGDYNNAIIYKSYAVKNTVYPSYIYIDEMEGLGDLYLSIGDYQKSKSIYEGLLHLCDSINIQDSIIYSNVLSHSAIVYNYIGDYEKSIKLGEKCVQMRHDLVKKEIDIDNSLPNYINSLINYAIDLINLDKDYSLISSYLEDALQAIYKNRGWYSDTLRYSRIISLKGTCFRKLGRTDDAINCFKRAAKLQEKLDDEHYSYVSTLSELSKTYEELLDYETAYNVAIKAKSFLESKKAEHHPIYAGVIQKMACLNYYMGNYPQALKMSKDIIDISKTAYGDSRIFAQTLNNLAAFYSNVGDYRNSLMCYKTAYDILESNKIYGETYSVSCFGLSDYQTNKDSVLYYLNKAEDALKQMIHFDTDRVMAALLKRKIAFYLDNMHDTVNALQLCNEAMEKISTNGKETLKYADYLDVMSMIYRNKDKGKSFQFCDSAFVIRKKVMMKNNLNYANALLRFTKGLIDIDGNKDSVINNCKIISDIMINSFNQSVLSIPYKSVNGYWRQHFHDFFDNLIPSVCCSHKTADSNMLMYDVLLFSKGLLLSVDMNIRNYIMQSQNEELISLFKNYNKLGAYINAQIALPASERTVNLDTIIKKQDNSGWLLSKKIIENGYNMLYKSTWTDVQKQLKEREVAIEFGNYTDAENNSLYYALTLNKQSKTPKLYNLFTETQLDSLLKKERIDSLELASLIWSKLYKEIINADTVYFSPSGRLNLIGIEYLPMPQYESQGSLELIRLSSTRELCKRNIFGEIKSAVLYGGIDYNSKDAVEKGNNMVYFDKYHNSLTRSITDRGGFDFLDNTIEEIGQISDILKDSGVNCEMLDSTHGTEASLKKLSGMPVDILHLATHGMYLNLDEAEKCKYKFVLSDETTSDEENAMSRSFVVMSGGNMILYNDSINTDNDGILTANEISYIDLHKIGLVTLSACDTAKGDVSYDGIVGLQRGFKKAGVRSLLMSLNKVDDEATKILMVEFYKNLISGKGKYQSLKDAQKYLCKVENGKYNKPEYWASFIMLDGLN